LVVERKHRLTTAKGLLKIMRKRTLLTYIAGALVAATTLTAAGSENKLYGASMTDGLPLTPIETLLEDPRSWEGKRVRIAGEVTGVCAKKGCWMDLTSAQDTTLRVKVDDDVIVFPRDAVGRAAEAEGTVEILEMDRETYESWLRHVAEEEGRAFAPSEIGEGPYERIQLRGMGAEIAGP